MQISMFPKKRQSLYTGTQLCKTLHKEPSLCLQCLRNHCMTDLSLYSI